MRISIEEFRKQERFLQKNTSPGEVYAKRQAKRFRRGPLGDIAMLSVQEVSRELAANDIDVYMHLDPVTGEPMDFATMRYSTAFAVEVQMPGADASYAEFMDRKRSLESNKKR